MQLYRVHINFKVFFSYLFQSFTEYIAGMEVLRQLYIRLKHLSSVKDWGKFKHHLTEDMENIDSSKLCQITVQLYWGSLLSQYRLQIHIIRFFYQSARN